MFRKKERRDMPTRKVKGAADQNNKTLPIKDVRQQNNLCYYWLNKRSAAKSPDKLFIYDRNYMMVFLGLNTAFRIEDLLQLRPHDLDGGYMRIKEHKTGKAQNFRLNPKVYSEVTDYCERNHIQEYDYIFKSRRTDGIIRAITRQQAHKVMKECCRETGIKYKVGPHSLRKTFGYNYMRAGGNIYTLMKMYNHSSTDTTQLYIMWTTDETEKERMNIFNGVASRIGKGEKK